VEAGVVQVEVCTDSMRERGAAVVALYALEDPAAKPQLIPRAQRCPRAGSALSRMEAEHGSF
jgi:hypothetical protein